MHMIHPRDLRKVPCLRAIFLHVLPSRIPKHLRRPRRIRHASRNTHHLPRRARRIRSILEERLQGAWEHFLEADHHDAVCCAVGDGFAGHVQPRGAGGAVVVDVVDGDGGHAELVEDALAAGGVAVAVACYALVDGVVVYLGVEEGFDSSLGDGWGC